MTTYSYARVSTKGQDLKDQIEQLKQQGVEDENIFSEKFTGTTADRPKFTELMNTVEKGDTIIVTKLDRFARNTEDALHWLRKLQDKGVKVNILNFGIVEDTPMGRFMITTLSAVADLERSFIVERTQSGKRYAKEHNENFTEGRPKSNKYSKVNGVDYDVINDYATTHSVRKTASKYGVAPSTVSKIKNIFKED